MLTPIHPVYFRQVNVAVLSRCNVAPLPKMSRVTRLVKNGQSRHYAVIYVRVNSFLCRSRPFGHQFIDSERVIVQKMAAKDM